MQVLEMPTMYMYLLTDLLIYWPSEFASRCKFWKYLIALMQICIIRQVNLQVDASLENSYLLTNLRL